jgi:hypothetical protein
MVQSEPRRSAGSRRGRSTREVGADAESGSTFGGKVFAIDPCTGNGRPHLYPLFDMLDTPYLERFAATGIAPEDVDWAFYTHFHPDDRGWSTQLRAGTLRADLPECALRLRAARI